MAYCDWTLDPRLYRWLWVLGLMGILVTQLMIFFNTFSTVVFWDGTYGGGLELLGIEDHVPFWVHSLHYLSMVAFLMGIAFYIRQWYHTRL